MNIERMSKMIKLPGFGMNVSIGFGLALGFIFELGCLLTGTGMSLEATLLVGAIGTMILIGFGVVFELPFVFLELLFLAGLLAGIGLAHGAIPLIRLYLLRNSGKI